MLMMLMIGTQSSLGMEEEGDGNRLTFKQRLNLVGGKGMASPCDQALITLTGFDHESSFQRKMLDVELFHVPNKDYS
jgi:hypothetical protein